jgi:flotillin
MTVFFLVTALVILFGIFMLMSTAFRKMWQVAGPNEALIISGGRNGEDGRTYNIVVGAGTFVIPGIQKASRLSLQLYEVPLEVACVTKQGIPVVLKGVCMFKVGNDSVSITNAASRFLGQEDKMRPNMLALLDGHLRSIAGNMTVEDLIGNRTELAVQTRDSAKVEVETLGLVIDSLQLQDLGDPSKYIENLSKPHIATAQQAARIAMAQADQAATIAEQIANAAKSSARAESEIKQAQYAASIAQAKAIADQQGPLASAEAQQKVIIAQTQITELEAARKTKQLEVDVRVPADAEAYRIQRLAEGARAAVIAQAEGDASRITQQGNAEAGAVKARLLAEADGIRARAEALGQNQDAVIAQTIAESLPAIVEKISAPFGNIKELIVTNGGDGLMSMVTSVATQVGVLLPVLRGALRSDGKTVLANGKPADGAAVSVD